MIGILPQHLAVVRGEEIKGVNRARDIKMAMTLLRGMGSGGVVETRATVEFTFDVVGMRTIVISISIWFHRVYGHKFYNI